MSSQVVPAEKRYRISLLLDAYGNLLTKKQNTFLHHYYEEDLSFGEIAREYGVSRQAIFDSVKHGEEALERFEGALHLVQNGWTRWAGQVSPERMAGQLREIRAELRQSGFETSGLMEKLDGMIALLSEPEGDESDSNGGHS